MFLHHVETNSELAGGKVRVLTSELNRKTWDWIMTDKVAVTIYTYPELIPVIVALVRMLEAGCGYPLPSTSPSINSTSKEKDS